MPSITQLIAGSITLVIGLFMFFHHKEYGEFEEGRALKPAKFLGSRNNVQYMAFTGLLLGVFLTGFGLNTLQFTGLSIFILIVCLFVGKWYKLLGHIIAAFFSKREPSVKKIRSVQRVFFLLVISVGVWAVSLTVVQWFE